MKEEPRGGKRSRCIYGSVETLLPAITTEVCIFKGSLMYTVLTVYRGVPYVYGARCVYRGVPYDSVFCSLD